MKKVKAKQVTIAKKAPHTSPSSMSMFLCCRRKAYFHLVRRITIKEPKLSLSLGKLWHAGLETWYTTKDQATAVRAIQKGVMDEAATGFSAFNTPATIAYYRAMLTGMLLGYIEKFGKKDLTTWKWKEAESEFELPNFFNTGITFRGTIDGIIEIPKGPNKGLWVVEHKTTKDLAYYTVEGIKQNIQTLAYLHAARQLFKIQLKGIIWNAVRKPSKRLKKQQTIEDYCKEIKEDYLARPDFYFYRQQLIINSANVEAWTKDVKHIMHDMECCFNHSTSLPHWYKNTAVCDMFGGCEFIPICTRGERRSTMLLYKDITHV